jgi:uncharacterized membrane protein
MFMNLEQVVVETNIRVEVELLHFFQHIFTSPAYRKLILVVSGMCILSESLQQLMLINNGTWTDGV